MDSLNLNAKKNTKNISHIGILQGKIREVNYFLAEWKPLRWLDLADNRLNNVNLQVIPTRI